VLPGPIPKISIVGTPLLNITPSGLIKKIFLAPFAVLFVFLILLFKPIVSIRVINIPYNFGDLLFTVQYFETIHNAWNATHLRKKFGLYCAFGRVTNSLLLEKISQKLFLLRNDFAWLVWKISLQLPNIVSVWSEFEPLYSESFNSFLTFSESEEIVASRVLQSANFSFVCLNVRDSAYEEHFGRSENFIRRSRNSNIDDYEDAIKYLLANDLVVFRMGSVVEKSVNILDPRFIDYAANGMRSELLDLYLGSKCKFAVSTGSGWDEVPRTFRRPLLYVNLFEYLRPLCLSRETILFPKTLLSLDDHRPLSLVEQIDLFHKGVFKLTLRSSEDVGVVIRDMSSEELVDAVTEMAQRVEGTFVETPEQKEMQAKAKHILSTHPKLQPSPNYYPIRTQFASCFLSRYPNFLDGLD